MISGAASISGSGGGVASTPVSASPVAMADRMGKPTNVIVNNYSGAQATAVEGVAPDGSRQITVTIENIMKKSIADGRFDGVMNRFGVRPQGVRT